MMKAPSIVLRSLCVCLPALVVALASPAPAEAERPVAAAADAQSAETPIGAWTTIDDETGKARSIVQIYEYEGKLRGKIIKLFENPDAICDKCKGPNKDKPVLGMIIMWDMVPGDDENEWSGGKVFDPEKGKTYRAKMWLEGDTLRLRGYAGPFFRTQTWRRAKAT